ncbi:SoxR reducing system RseC family protein [Desulfobacula sp.]
MIKEDGIVTNANTSLAWVKTIRSTACEHCASKDSCGTPGDLQEMTITVKNTLNVEKGDHVIIGLETRPILFVTFLLYVFPIILLITGAVIGNYIAPSFQMDPSLISILLGSLFFGLSFFIIRKKNNTLAKKEEYKPFLVKKRPPVMPMDCPSS